MFTIEAAEKSRNKVTIASLHMVSGSIKYNIEKEFLSSANNHDDDAMSRNATARVSS